MLQLAAMTETPLLSLEDVDDTPVQPPSVEAQPPRRHRTDSDDYRPPPAITPSAPARPEWPPAWPSGGFEADDAVRPTAAISPSPARQKHRSQQTRQQQLQEPMYAIRSASDVSIDSEGDTVVNQAALTAGEIAVPRRINNSATGDVLGLDSLSLDASDSYGKATLVPGNPTVPVAAANHGISGSASRRAASATTTATSAGPMYMTDSSRPSTGMGAVPFGRAQSGVYIHSLPSASEAEVPSSSSDSEAARGDRFLPRPPVDPPGHVAK